MFVLKIASKTELHMLTGRSLIFKTYNDYKTVCYNFECDTYKVKTVAHTCLAEERQVFINVKIIHDEKVVHQKHRVEEYNSEDGKEMIEERIK